MKRAFILSFLLLLFPVLVGCQSQLPKDCSGDIVMCNPNIGVEWSKDLEAGILIYSPKDNRYLYLANNIPFSFVSFSENKEKVLGITHNTHDCSIIEYDLKTKDITPIFNKGEKDTDLAYIQYVPNSDNISFISHPNFYIYNRKTKKKEFLIEAFGNYSWSNNGKKLFYSTDRKINCLDIDNKKTSLYINNGFQPQLSTSNDYIAFQAISNNLNLANSNLVVKEVKTGKEWRYKIPIQVCAYKFSPNDRYLAIIERTLTKNGIDINLIGWDFKNNKKVKLIEHIRDGSWSDFDWK